MLKGKYNKLVVELNGYVIVTRENYDKGELGTITSYDLHKESFIIEDVTNKDSLLVIKNKLIEYLCGYSYETLPNIQTLDIYENKASFSQYTDDENEYAPTKNDMELFKQGLKDLFLQDINIAVTINGEPILEDDLELIINL